MLEIASAAQDPAPTKVMAKIMRAEIDLNINIEMPLYRSKTFAAIALTRSSCIQISSENHLNTIRIKATVI
jgi:hypothetical protein